MKTLVAAALAAALLAAPLPALIHNAQAQTTQTKPAKKAKSNKSKKPPTAGQLAARKRAKECGAEWRAAKKAGKIEEGMTWPKYWSACNKRLRAAGK